MPGESAECEHNAERGQLGRIMVPEERGPGDERREHDQRERETPMEAAGLEARPVVEKAHDLTAFVRVRADRLARARIADLGPPAVPDKAALAIVPVGPEVLPLGTFPRVQVRVVAEPRRPEALRSPVRVASEQIETRGDTKEKERVAPEQDRLWMRLGHKPSSRAPTGSVISVKRMSGCSSVTRGTV
jgi:hypothetical protein